MGIRRKISLVLNACIVVFTLLALFMTFTGWGNSYQSDAELTTQGFANLKYFTVLSNLLSGIASAVYLVATARTACAGIPRAVSVLKLAATTSVALTFFTVVVLFRFLWGLHGLFQGANLWFHLLLPLAALASMCFFDAGIRLKVSDTFIATAPMVLYGLAYYANILVNGMGTPPNSNDWYGLASAGLQWAPLVFATMFAGTLTMAMLVYAVRKHLFPAGSQ